MNDPSIAGALDAGSAVPPALLVRIDPASDDLTAAGLPADHPTWQRDVVSMSSRARALAATLVPIVVRVVSFWDHRIREIAFGARTLGVDPAGCYRLR